MAARDEGGGAFGWLALAAAAAVLIFAAPRRAVNFATPPHGRGVGPHEAGGHALSYAATRPSDIPARGWWAIVKRVVADVSSNRLMTEAAGITFYALLSIFPALAALVSLAGLILDPSVVSKDVSALSGVIPGGGTQVLNDQLTRLTSTTSSSLSIGLVVGLLVSLWSSNQAMKALFDSLNKVYGETEKRGYFKRTVQTLCFTVGGLLFVIIAMALVVVLPIVLGYVGLGGVTDVIVRVVRWPLLLVAVTVFLALVYRYGPSREQAQWRWVSWGSAFAAIAWVIVSLAFSWYVTNFGNYNKTYGSLGAVIGFMTWIWLSALVMLVGAQLDAEMEVQTTADTTTGPPQPIGARGAAAADTVAPAA